jgi:DNA polymerase
MAGELKAVRQELERLRDAGVDRVFLDDATLDLLASADAPTPTPTPVPAAVKAAAPVPAPRAKKPAAAPAAFPEPPTVELPEGDAASRLAWLRQRVENCPVCREHLSEKGQIVFGEGPAEADIFFCGEAPGADEAIAGQPFVGQAGQLLTKIIAAMGLERDQVYIGNILKWRPEQDKPYGNRPPTPEEMAFCLPYLRAQIEIIRPKVLVALGNTAVSGLLGPDPKRRMDAIRGTWHEFEGIPLMITFHPSYLLRHDTLRTKRLVWEDMLQVMDLAGLPVSGKQRRFFLHPS